MSLGLFPLPPPTTDSGPRAAPPGTLTWPYSLYQGDKVGWLQEWKLTTGFSSPCHDPRPWRASFPFLQLTRKLLVQWPILVSGMDSLEVRL